MNALRRSFLLIAGALSTRLALGADGFLVVDRAGKPACVVRIRKDATAPEKTAAKVLIEHVAKCTGVTLPRLSKWAQPEKPVISLELNPDAPKPKNPRHRTRDGFTVDVTTRKIRIVGDNPPSVIYGVCSFLEKYLGVRWLAPGELWTVTPKRRALAVSFGRYSERATFPIRCLHTTGVQTVDGVRYAHWHPEAADWAMHNRINRKVEHVGRFRLRDLMAERGLKPLRSGHCMKFWMPNDIFYDEHPEFYAYNGDRRVPIARGGTQLNYSCIEMSEAFAHRVIDYLEEGHPEADQMGISLNDGYGFSIDPIAKANWFYDDHGLPIVSDNVFGFTNRVAEIVSKVHPDVLITQLAYTPYYHRPPRFPIHPNVGIRFTMYRGSSVHPMCEARNDRDKQMRWELEEWRKLTRQVIVGEYLSTYWADAMFASGVRMIAGDLKWYHEMGFPGCYTEYQVGKPAREMMYVYNRLLWDPAQDEMDLIRDYYAATYGPAAGKMLKAYSVHRDATEVCGYDGVGTYLAVALANVDGFVSQMQTLTKQALALAATPAQRARIEQVRTEFDAWMKRAEPYAPYEFPFREPTREDLFTDNAVANPSFEDTPADWTFTSRSPEVTGLHTNVAAWEGRRSLAIVSPKDHPISARAQWSTSVPVEKGEVYRVETMVKLDRPARESMAVLYLHTGGTDHRRGKAGPALMYGDWRPLGLGVVKAVSDRLGIVIRLYRGAGTCYLDALRVQKLEKKGR